MIKIQWSSFWHVLDTAKDVDRNSPMLQVVEHTLGQWAYADNGVYYVELADRGNTNYGEVVLHVFAQQTGVTETLQ